MGDSLVFEYILYKDINIDSYGGIILPLQGEYFITHNLQINDIITVQIGSYYINMPIAKSYNFVDNGVSALIFEKLTDNVQFITMGGQFVLVHHIAHKENNKWVLNENFSYPLSFKFYLKETQGYLKTYTAYSYLFDRRSNNRDDYADKSDEEFANFRNVTVGNIKPLKLYRSSSPVNKRFLRHAYVDALIKKANITKFVNLSDGIDTMQKKDYIFEDTYYSKQDVLFLQLPADYFCSYFEQGLKKAYLHMIKNDEPTLIHCVEGKDRTGFAIAILEALMGAKKSEIVADYFLSFKNFFRIEDDDPSGAVMKMNIIDFLSQAFSTTLLKDDDLPTLANNYLLRIGLTNLDIIKIKKYLGGDDYEKK